tara:strand:+ start:555 stop:779 length:225 start_codon:yes stop_codon:yes gene_type:complete
MPKVVDKSGRTVKEEDYTPGGIKRAQQMAAEDPDLRVENTQQYKAGGAVRRGTPKRVKTRGTGAATKGLYFYES